MVLTTTVWGTYVSRLDTILLAGVTKKWGEYDQPGHSYECQMQLVPSLAPIHRKVRSSTHDLCMYVHT